MPHKPPFEILSHHNPARHFGGAVSPDVPTVAVASSHHHSRRASGGARRGRQETQRGLRAFWPLARRDDDPRPRRPPRIPFTYWAQRKDRLFLTLECPNAEDPKVHLTDDGVLTFSANAKSDSTEADHHYELKLELLHPINAKDSQIHVGPRRTTMVIAKTEEVSGRRDVSSPFFSVFGVSVFSRVRAVLSGEVTPSHLVCRVRRFPLTEPHSRVWKRTPFRRRPSLPPAKNAGPHWPRLLRRRKKPARQNRFRQVGGRG